MRKLLLIGLAFLGISTAHAAKIAVTVYDGSLQPNTTNGFNVSSGTVQNFRPRNVISTGTWALNGATFTFSGGVQTLSSATASDFTATRATATFMNVRSSATANGMAVIWEQVKQLWSYRRPRMVWSSITQIAAEANAQDLTNTVVLFPDGQVRIGTPSAMVITRNANWADAGTLQGGLRPSLTEASNTWYAIYLVKSTKAGALDSFVVVGDTVTPNTAANFTTLNSTYGTSGWVYLGMVRNGDQGSTANDLLDFDQNGNYTRFRNTITGANAVVGTGILMATTASAATLTYSNATGTSGATTPTSATIATWQGSWGVPADNLSLTGLDSTGTRTYARTNTNGANNHSLIWETAVSEGVQLINGGGTAIVYDIALVGFRDRFLSLGSNPY